MSKSKVLFDLIMCVNAKRCFTAQNVADEFDISLRTAHRYLLEISEMGVPLYTEPGRNGGYRVLNNRVLPPIAFEEDEAFAIFFAFQSLKYYRSLPFEINIASASGKLYASLPDDLKTKMNRLDEVLSFWNLKRSVDSPYLKEIIEAALRNQAIHMEYESKSRVTIREVVPLGVYAYNGFWYMPASNTEQEHIRVFRIDRILSLQYSDNTCSVPMKLDEWLARSNEIMTPVRLYVLLTEEGMRQCKSEPWLEPYIKSASNDAGCIDTVIDQSEIRFSANYFFQLGTEAKVIEPREMSEMIKQKALELMEHYNS